MKRVFGAKKDKEPPPSVQDASDRVRELVNSIDIYYIRDSTSNCAAIAFLCVTVSMQLFK